MLKNTLLVFGLAPGIGFCVIAGENPENLLENGSFENSRKLIKSSSQYLLDRVRKGWDVGKGPVAELPTGWTLAGVTGSVSMRFVDKNAKGEELNVIDGSRALKLTGSGSFYCASKLQPGEYVLKIHVKGKGEVVVHGFFCYNWVSRTQPSPNKTQSAVLLRAKGGSEWKEWYATVKLGVNVKQPCDFCTICISVTDADPIYLDNVSIESLPREKAK
ncbi:MAG: hypothetical protein BWY31_00923 [Lentisphaerae bacterium ADurb.Bin242]|nr:MAG: hypothetical protein BWY31_00923 [Lentisphaerae bacterium ADurb.Bin242]